MAIPVYILNGPNLNLLGVRQPHVYGSDRLADIEALCVSAGQRLGFSIDFRQTNHEGTLVDWIQEGGEKAHGIVINPAAYSHTSIAVADAIRSIEVPVIEVHLSNIFAREAFRHHSYISPVAAGIICGLGARGYELALEALTQLVADRAAG
jgi:3-dehydroquinate dehydratase-2